MNQVSKLDWYLFSYVEDLLTTLSGRKAISKLILSQAYQQLALTEESKPYPVINTHKGLYQYTPLPFGGAIEWTAMVSVLSLIRVRAMMEAPAPHEFKSYLGLLTHYSKFLPNLSTILAPIYRLLCQSSQWQWGQAETKAFKASKELLTSAPLLVQFDSKLALTLACDASAYSIGVIVSHKMPDGSEKPSGFASRTLSETGKYPQIWVQLVY